MSSLLLFAVDLIAKATVLLLVATIATAALRHRPAAVRHRIWCLAFAGLLCLPLLSLLLPRWDLPILPTIAGETTGDPRAFISQSTEIESSPLARSPESVVRSDPAINPTHPNANQDHRGASELGSAPMQPIEVSAPASAIEVESPGRTEPVPWGRIAPAAWLLGILVAFLPLLISEIRNQVLRQSTKVIDDPFGMLHQLRHELRLRRNVRWLESKHPVMPMTLGVVRPIVLFPDSWKQWSGSRLRLVLMHELAHVKRFDVAFQMMARIACALYWFHPLVWYGLKRLRVERELACDDCVLMTGARPSEYASELLEIARQFPAIRLSTAVAMAQNSNLEQRIGSMLDAARSHLPIGGAAARALMLAAAVFVTAVAVIKPATIADETSLAEPQQQAETVSDKRDGAADTVTNSGRVPLPDGTPASGATARAAKVAANEPLRFEGQVVDPEGRPVKGAKLYLAFDSESPNPEATSDAQGRFSFSVDSSSKELGESASLGFTNLVASADGYGLATQMAILFEQSGQLWDELPSNIRDYYRKLTAKSKPVLRLPNDDVQLHGRIVDSEGQPVENARVELDRVWYNDSGSLDQWEEESRNPKADFYSLRSKAPMMLSSNRLTKLLPSQSSGTDGRFTIRGVGNERVVHLLVSAPGLETMLVKARTRPGKEFDVPNSWDSRDRAARREKYYASEFSLVLPASVPVVGRITDSGTGAPIEGVVVSIANRRSFTSRGNEWPQAVTDQDGRYRLEGAPIGDQIVAVRPAEHHPYLPGGISLTTTAGQDVKRLDCELAKGVWVKGNTLDDRTGMPLTGLVQYFVDNGNSNRDQFRSYGRGNTLHQFRVSPSGEFAIPVMPGRGIITFMASGADDFQRGVGAETISVPSAGIDMGGRGRSFYTSPYILSSQNANVLQEINPPPGSAPVSVQLIATSGEIVLGRLLGPDGKPLPAGRVRADDSALNHVLVNEETFEFQCRGYYPDRPRVINFVHIEKDLAARLELSGKAPRDLVVRLKPAARITGRLVDLSGAPLARAKLYGSNLVMRDNGATELRYATDDNGRFELRGIVPGVKYDIRAVRDGMFLGDVLKQFSVDSARSVDVGDIVPAHDHGVDGVSIKVEAAESDRAVLRGKVLGPNGQPLKEAQIWISGFGQTAMSWKRTRQPRVNWKRIAESDVAGRFEAELEVPDQIDRGGEPQSLTVVATADGLGFGAAKTDLSSLEDEVTLQLVDDVPINGQIVTAEGTPASGVSIDIATLPSDVKDIDAAVKNAPLSSGIYTNWQALRGGPPGIEAVQTDSNGRFRLTGMGADRYVRLDAIGGGIGATRLMILTHRTPPERLPSGVIAVREGLRESNYFASFVHIGAPSRTIKGTVTDEISGEPIEGARVSAYESWQARANPAVTDANGHYELKDLPQLASYQLTFSANATNHLNKRQLPSDSGGNDPLILNVSLHPGIVASGRLVDPETRDPVEGTLEYNPLFPNENWPKLGEQRTANPASTVRTDEDGNWQLGVLPGPGAISVRTNDTRFVKARVKRSELEALDENLEILGDEPVLRILQPAAGDQTRGIMELGQAVALINPSPGSGPLTVEHKLVLGRTRSGTIVDESSVPVLGAEAIGLGGCKAQIQPNQPAQFEVSGLVKGRKDLLLFLHKQRGLGAKLEVTGDELTPLTAQLTPTGTLTGRFVDELGQPLSTAWVNLHVRDLDRVAVSTGLWESSVDQNGRFRIEGLIPGVEYGVECQVPEHPVALYVPAEVRVESGQTLDIGQFTKEDTYRFKLVKDGSNAKAENR